MDAIRVTEFIKHVAKEPMNGALSAVRLQFELLYFRYIVLLSRSATEHIHHVKHVKHVLSLLSLLSDAIETLRLKMCSFLPITVYYLGHGTLSRPLETASHTTSSLKGLKSPRNVGELNLVVSKTK